MINHIISEVVESDRNIYLTIEDGALVSVNYSHGSGEFDHKFLHENNQALTTFVRNEIVKTTLGSDLYSPDYFFPSPYWDEQIKTIDDAIWKFIQEEQLKEETRLKIEAVQSEIQKVENRLYILQEELNRLRDTL